MGVAYIRQHAGALLAAPSYGFKLLLSRLTLNLQSVIFIMIDEVAYSILEAPMNSTAAKNNPGSNTRIPLFALLLVPVVVASLLGFTCRSAYGEVDCLKCHEELTKKKVVHAAVQRGCPTCHSAIDAADVPHKKTNTITKGLSSKVPDLCYGCHDKKMFEGKDVHPPVMGGMCLSCHNPHSTDSPKLLVAEAPLLCFKCHDKIKFENKTTHPPVKDGMCLTCHFPHKSDSEKLLQTSVPDLCFKCHDKTEFTRKNIHSPVAAGMCLTCHVPHASKYENLTAKLVTGLCTSCHTDKYIKNGIHIVRGTASSGHPVSGKKDPKREGKKFTCASCHNPHSSDFTKLLRYKGDAPFEICINCHQM